MDSSTHSSGSRRRSRRAPILKQGWDRSGGALALWEGQQLGRPMTGVLIRVCMCFALVVCHQLGTCWLLTRIVSQAGKVQYVTWAADS